MCARPPLSHPHTPTKHLKTHKSPAGGSLAYIGGRALPAPGAPRSDASVCIATVSGLQLLFVLLVPLLFVYIRETRNRRHFLKIAGYVVVDIPSQQLIHWVTLGLKTLVAAAASWAAVLALV